MEHNLLVGIMTGEIIIRTAAICAIESAELMYMYSHTQGSEFDRFQAITLTGYFEEVVQLTIS